MSAIRFDKPLESQKTGLLSKAFLGLALPAILTIMLFVIALFVEILPAIEGNFMERKREMIAELTKGAWHILSYYHDQEEKGLLSRKQAQKKAIEQIRTMRYGAENKDYFWINDFNPIIIMHPYRNDLEGKNVSDFKDPKGTKLFSEFVQVVRKKNQGFVDYMWQWKDNPEKIVPKVSFVKGFKPWSWIIGTGIYVEDVSSQVAKLSTRLSYISLLILFVVALLEFYIVQKSIRSEHKRFEAETKSRSSQWMLRLVMDNIPQLIFWKDKFGAYLGCNRGFATYVGLNNPGDIKGRTDNELPVQKPDASSGKVRELRVMNSGASELHVIESHYSQTGNSIWMDTNRIPLKDEKENIVGVLCTYDDITHQIKTTKALEESERRFRTLVENVQVGITIVQDSHIVYANPEQDRIVGPVKLPFPLKRLRPFASPDMNKLLNYIEGEPDSQGTVWDLDLTSPGRKPKEGQVLARWVHCRTRNITYQGKDALLVIMLDITKPKELEQMVRIQDKMASLGRVAAGIAHEIRNPLSGINMYLSALKLKAEECQNLDVLEIIAKMQHASAKTEAVIKRVLDFSKPHKPKLDWINLNRLVQSVRDLSSVTLRKNGITLKVSLAKSLPLVHVDAGLLEQVMMNLLTNAVQAMADWQGERVIRISSSLEKNRILIKMADSGPGVPLENRQRIFDPFFTGRKEGSGVGLSLCHRIVTDHGGQLTVTDSPLGGAQFTIEIPAIVYWGYQGHG